MNERGIPDKITVAQAAELLKCSPGVIRAMIAEGELEAVKVGNRWMITGRYIATILGIIGDKPFRRARRPVVQPKYADFYPHEGGEPVRRRIYPHDGSGGYPRRPGRD